MDDLADFCRRLPAWCGPDGLPRSWRHYVYGRRHLARANARRRLGSAASTRLGQATREGYERFRRAIEPYTR